MNEQLMRRDFSRVPGIGTAAGSGLFAANSARKLKIRHTGMTCEVPHMHLKDYSRGPGHLGYCPPGQEKVNIPAVLHLVDEGNMQGTIMVGLDPSPQMPIVAGETARMAGSYLQKIGYTFRSWSGQ